jgi:hypothetical protein
MVRGLPVEQPEVAIAMTRVLEICTQLDNAFDRSMMSTFRLEVLPTDNAFARTMMSIFQPELMPTSELAGFARTWISSRQQAVNIRWLDNQTALLKLVDVHESLKNHMISL